MPPNLESLEYLKLLIGTNDKFYEDCQIIVHIICTAVVYFSVESILESYVSMHEHRINLNRAGKINEERHSQELCIYINGPPMHLCLPIVKEAMNSYWHKKLSKRGLESGISLEAQKMLKIIWFQK